VHAHNRDRIGRLLRRQFREALLQAAIPRAVLDGAQHTFRQDHSIKTTLRPGGKARVRCLSNTVAFGRLDSGASVTHHYKRDGIESSLRATSS